MAGNVIDFYENIVDQDDHSTDAQARGGSQREYKRFFQARVDGDSFKSWEMKSYVETPKLYQYDPDGGGYVTNVSVTKNPRAKHRIFDIEVTYDPDIELSEYQSNPTLRPARVKVDGIEFESTHVVDIDGIPIANKAGTLINWKTQTPGVIFRIEKNIAAAPAAWFLNLASVTNSLAVTLEGLTFPPRTLLMRKPSIGFIEKEGTFSYRRAEIEVHYNTKTWSAIVQNVGTVERRVVKVIPTGGGSPEDVPITVPIADDKGNNVTEPVDLDDDGAALRDVGVDGKSRIRQTVTSKNTISYQVYPEKDFNVIFNLFFYNNVSIQQ